MNQTKTVLLVENEAVIALHQARILEDAGYRVVAAKNGEAALELVRTNPDISLVLSDIYLGPGMDGVQTAEEILRVRELPVVFLTSHADRETVERVKNVTRFGYVLKSAGEFVLLESIGMAYELFRVHQERKRDTVEHERLIAELAASDKKFAIAFQSCPEAMAIASLEDGTLFDVNDVFLEITGCRRDELIGHSTIELGIWADPDERKRYLVERSKTGRLRGFETRFRIRSGEIRDFTVSGGVIEIGGQRYSLIFMMDITEKKREEEKHRQSEERLRMIVERSEDSIALTDEEGRIIEWNPGCERSSGLPKEEVIGMTFWDLRWRLLPEQQRTSGTVDGYRAAFLDALRTGRSPFFEKPIEAHYVSANGETRIEQQSAFPIPTQRGFRIGMIGRDVTQHRRDETEIRRLLDERELLLAEVHHRIKNDMNIIASVLSLQADSSENPQLSQALQEAKTRVNVMHRIYNNLYREQYIGVVPLKSFIVGLVDDLVFSYDVTNAVHLETDIIEKSVDRRITFPIGVIVNEIVTNTYKYAFTDRRAVGRIRISVRETEQGGLSLAIADNGCGYPEAIIAGSACGFGLNLVKLLAKQLETAPRFRNDADGGAAFELDIPPAKQ